VNILVIGFKRFPYYWESRIAELLSKKYNITFISRYNPSFPDKNFDIIIHLQNLGLDTAVEAKKRYRCPLIVEWSGVLLEEELKQYTKIVDVAITWTKWGAKRLKDYYGLETKIIPLGADKDLIVDNKEKRKDFTFIGSNWKHKRIPMVVEACKRANVNLKIISGNSFNFDIEIGACERTNLKTHFKVYENTIGREKYKILASSKALLHASIQEGFNIPITEALSVGTPVITYNLPIYKELYNDVIGKYVFLWNTMDEFIELIKSVDEKEIYIDKDYILKKKYTIQDHVKRLEEMIS